MHSARHWCHSKTGIVSAVTELILSPERIKQINKTNKQIRKQIDTIFANYGKSFQSLKGF